MVGGQLSGVGGRWLVVSVLISCIIIMIVVNIIMFFFKFAIFIAENHDFAG